MRLLAGVLDQQDERRLALDVAILRAAGVGLYTSDGGGGFGGEGE
jgi:hypothetical protein